MVVFSSEDRTITKVVDGYEIRKIRKHNELLTKVVFQRGCIPFSGVNGCTMEDLIVVCKDRLEGFQQGDFACNENKEAIEYLTKALNALDRRTDRVNSEKEKNKNAT